ncbi:hypothetical protein [Nocardia sp. NPDC003345]
MKRVFITIGLIGGIVFGGSGLAAADNLALFPFSGPYAEANCRDTLAKKYAGQAAYCRAMGQADKNGFMMWGLFTTKRV